MFGKATKKRSSWLRSTKVKKACSKGAWKAKGHSTFIECASFAKGGAKKRGSGASAERRKVADVELRGALTAHKAKCKTLRSAPGTTYFQLQSAGCLHYKGFGRVRKHRRHGRR